MLGNDDTSVLDDYHFVCGIKRSCDVIARKICQDGIGGSVKLAPFVTHEK